MAPAPFQPIPDSTQVHVDRLVGAQLGELQVDSRVAEGRFGTIYRAHQRASGKEVTLEVLRTELTGDDEEVRAGKALKCAGIADVFAFGQVPDGRRYRVMEFLDGESLGQLLQRGGRLSPPEVVRILGQVAEVLQTAHSWALPHGSLGPSSVFLVRGAVKLIDFGLGKQKASLEADLQALGALGYVLLTGEELGDRGPPPLGSGIPEPVDRLLRELMEKRVTDATAARRELALVLTLADTPPPTSPSQTASQRAAPPAKPHHTRALPLAALAIALAGGGAAALFLWSRAPETEPPPPAQSEERPTIEGATGPETTEGEARDLPEPEPAQTAPRPLTSTTGPRRAPVPSATALMASAARLESQFRQQARPGDDVDQALFVLNKQRLRLSGSPTEQDRKDVAQQLADWRHSYLQR